MHHELDARSRSILYHIVDTFIKTGEPIGSKTLSARLETTLSPATIRNIMADLVEAGLLYAPHTSAGRLPTEAGVRFFVHGLLQFGTLSALEKKTIEAYCSTADQTVQEVLEKATTLISGLSKCAGLVIAPKTDQALKHMEFISIGGNRALVVMVTDDGIVENRIIDLPEGMPLSALIEASNYTNMRLRGKTIMEAKQVVSQEITAHQAQLNVLAAKLVEKGLATWSGIGGALIVKGQSHLLQDVTHMEELESVRHLFSLLEVRESLLSLLDAANQADGVQIFVGRESNFFNVTGCSVIIAPYQNAKEQIVGVIGVLGPTRINYGKIIPIVDYTARMLTHLLSNQSSQKEGIQNDT